MAKKILLTNYEKKNFQNLKPLFETVAIILISTSCASEISVEMNAIILPKDLW